MLQLIRIDKSPLSVEARRKNSRRLERSAKIKKRRVHQRTYERMNDRNDVDGESESKREREKTRAKSRKELWKIKKVAGREGRGASLLARIDTDIYAREPVNHVGRV